MFDTMKMQGEKAVSTLKGELTKTPEQLSEKQLGRANRLATVFTIIRKAVYFIMPIFGLMAAITFTSTHIDSSPYIFTNIFWILLWIYIIFKARDLLRGKI